MRRGIFDDTGTSMDELSGRAVAAAVAAAATQGLRCDAPEVLADGSNVLVRLGPAPVVARVATTTALVRKPIERWMQMDVDLAGYLASEGFPAVAPSREIAPGPHVQDGFAVSFWEYVEQDRNDAPSVDEVGGLLRELHGALRGYRGELRRLSPFAEIPEWLDEVERWGTVDAGDVAMLRRGYEQVAKRIDRLRLPEQALHGDAHKKNLLKTSRGLLWTDFEDACRGPVEWDLACFVRTSGEDRKASLASYGGITEMERLVPFFEARDLQGGVWGAVLSTRFADRRERAAEWMDVCRARYG
jgi:Phosphotransferase enzyme family